MQYDPSCALWPTVTDRERRVVQGIGCVLMWWNRHIWLFFILGQTCYNVRQNLKLTKFRMLSNDVCLTPPTIFKDHLKVAASIFKKQSFKKSTWSVEFSLTVKKLGSFEILKILLVSFKHSGRKPSAKTMNLKNQKFHPLEVCCRHLHGNPNMSKVAE